MVPAPASRSAIRSVNAPVPGPSSTTTGSPVSGTGAQTIAASARELGVGAAVRDGSRRNSRTNAAVGDDVDSVVVISPLPRNGAPTLVALPVRDATDG